MQKCVKLAFETVFVMVGEGEKKATSQPSLQLLTDCNQRYLNTLYSFAELPVLGLKMKSQMQQVIDVIKEVSQLKRD